MDRFLRQASDEGFNAIAGVDEAGRGPLAGPVVAAACILRSEIAGLNDSKKLSEKRREALFEELMNCCAYGIGIVDAKVIDEINVLQATFRAMALAVKHMPVPPDFLLVDGNLLPPIPIPSRAIVKGDQCCVSIMAASIIAKVTRDRMMIAIDRLYPAYNFAKHKGYGTKAHTTAIEEHGICPEHRRTFLRKLLHA